MCAMLEISKNARLKELGWKLLLQVDIQTWIFPLQHFLLALVSGRSYL